MKRRALRGRIFYGPKNNPTSMWWNVTLHNAKRPLSLRGGGVYHVLGAEKGMTIGCALSRIAMDGTNREKFPRPVSVACFYKRCLLVGYKKSPAGGITDAIRYKHNYAHLVEANDKGVLEELIKDNPEALSFLTLYPWPDPRPRAKSKKRRGLAPAKNHSGRGQAQAKSTKRTKPPITLDQYTKDALKRAIDAGIIAPAVATQLELPVFKNQSAAKMRRIAAMTPLDTGRIRRPR